jgi:translation initiation factor IF-2
MGLKPFQVVQDLMEMSIFASWVEAIDLKVATRICKKHGFVLRVEEEDEPVHPGVSS